MFRKEVRKDISDLKKSEMCNKSTISLNYTDLSIQIKELSKENDDLSVQLRKQDMKINQLQTILEEVLDKIRYFEVCSVNGEDKTCIDTVNGKEGGGKYCMGSKKYTKFEKIGFEFVAGENKDA